MFDRQTHLLESLRVLAAFTGDVKTGNRLKDEPYSVVRTFAHSYSIFRSIFPDHLNLIDSRPLEQLFGLVNEIKEKQPWEIKPIKWLRTDVKTARLWKKLLSFAC